MFTYINNIKFWVIEMMAQLHTEKTLIETLPNSLKETKQKISQAHLYSLVTPNKHVKHVWNVASH